MLHDVEFCCNGANQIPSRTKAPHFTPEFFVSFRESCGRIVGESQLCAGVTDDWMSCRKRDTFEELNDIMTVLVVRADFFLGAHSTFLCSYYGVLAYA